MSTKTTIYHSELVQLSPAQVVINSDALNSKYPGKPQYFLLQVNGVERFHTPENPGCFAALQGRRGQTVLLTATGSRDTAALQVQPLAGGAALAPQPAAAAATAPQPAAAPPPPGQQQYQQPAAAAQQQVAVRPVAAGLDAARLDVAKRGMLMTLCCTEARAVRSRYLKAYPGEQFTEERVQAVAASLFIGADRCNMAQHIDPSADYIPM